MAGRRVLVVDDDPSLRVTLERGLGLEGFDVRTAPDGWSAIDTVGHWSPDLIVLDVGMPGMDGVEVCRRLRTGGVGTPICILSARDEVDDRVAGLRAGADDYLVKPFALVELEARLEALLRRQEAHRQDGPGQRDDSDRRNVPDREGALVIGALHIDGGRRQVLVEGSEVELTRREFDLLDTLARHRDIVLTREQLLDLVWGHGVEATTNVVDVFVGYLRRKLEAGGQPRLIHTVRGVGFVLRA